MRLLMALLCTGALPRAAALARAAAVELQLPHGPPPSAATALRALADAAERHGVDFPDVYGEASTYVVEARPWLRDFEADVARHLGKEAAVWCPSGKRPTHIPRDVVNLAYRSVSKSSSR